jgi:hypothetical protein
MLMLAVILIFLIHVLVFDFDWLPFGLLDGVHTCLQAARAIAVFLV